MLTSLTVFLVILASAVSAAPASDIHPRRTQILPVVSCQNDNPYPHVIFAPSEPGLDLAANQYVVCIRGEPLVFDCPEGLFFNWSTMTCDFPYERRSRTNATEEGGDFDVDLLIPAGPIPVPIPPHLPIPILGGANLHPIPPRPPGFFPGPVTKPDPSEIMPLPVLPARPPPVNPRPVPYHFY